MEVSTPNRSFYPADLASILRQRWAEAGYELADLPDEYVLESLIDTLTEGFDPYRSKCLPKHFESVRSTLLSTAGRQGICPHRSRDPVRSSGRLLEAGSCAL